MCAAFTALQLTCSDMFVVQQFAKRNSHSLLQFSTLMGAQHELQKLRVTVKLLTANVNRTIKCRLELLNHLFLSAD